MKIEGTYNFNAPLSRVWQALLDPARLSQCIPGCDSLEPTGDGRYAAVMTLGIAAIRGTFRGTVAIQDRQELQSYRLVVEGQGTPGFVRGEGTVTLTANGTGTTVRLDGDAQFGGTMALVGQRMVAPVAQLVMNRFFDCVRKTAEGSA